MNEVKRAFSDAGIQLESLAPSPSPQTYVQLSGESHGIDVTVQVYRRARHRYIVLFLGNGKSRTGTARNVVVSWSGEDLPAVRAALDDLR